MMPPQKKPAAAPAAAAPSPTAADADAAANRGVKRKANVLETLSFVPPNGKDSISFLEKDVMRVAELVQAAIAEPAASRGASNLELFTKLQDYRTAADAWISQEFGKSKKTARDGVLATAALRKLRSAIMAVRSEAQADVRLVQERKEAADEAGKNDIKAIWGRLVAARTKNKALNVEMHDMQTDNKKKLQRKQNELKVVEEMTARLTKDLKNKITRRKVVFMKAQRAAQAAAGLPPGPAAASSVSGKAPSSSILAAAARPKPEPKKVAPKTKGRGKGKGARAGVVPGSPPAARETAAEAAARREYEMDRRMRIAEAAQPIPGLMPQFNEQGQTVGWMDTNGNWITGETTRGSKKLLLHLKAINYDPRQDPDGTDGDSTPTLVQPATTPPEYQDPLTPISRLSENSGGGATTDIPTSPEEDPQPAKRLADDTNTS